MRKKRVYVSGPISGGNQFGNVSKGVIAGQAIWDMGGIPFVPHLSALGSIAAPDQMSYEDWMEFDFAWLDACDALFRIPGVSPGADREVAYATKLGVPVFDRLVDLAEYLATEQSEPAP